MAAAGLGVGMSCCAVYADGNPIDPDDLSPFILPSLFMSVHAGASDKIIWCFQRLCNRHTVALCKISINMLSQEVLFVFQLR